jgi:hypothetical protein
MACLSADSSNNGSDSFFIKGRRGGGYSGACSDAPLFFPRQDHRVPAVTVPSSSLASKWAIATLTLAVLSGCGGDEPFTRHRITGTVTYQGQPVERGMIFIEPADSSVGVSNQAPYGFLHIKGGKFESSTEDSPTSGTYRLKVMGLDASQMPERGVVEGDVPTLFPTYELLVEMPPPNNHLDIEVPDEPPVSSRGRR